MALPSTSALLLALVLLACQCPAQSPSDAFRAVQIDLAEQYCPFSGLLGTYYCPIQTSSAAVRPKDGSPRLPGLIGQTWNPLSRKLGLPVFQFTFSGKTTWTASNGLTYTLPDEVNFAQLDPTNPHKNIATYPDSIDYLNTVLAYSYGNTEVWGGLYSHSLSMDELFVNLFGSGKVSISVSQGSWSYYHLAMKPGLSPLSDRFVDALRMLPQAYDPAIYSLFLDFFPAFVVTEADFGGALEQQTMTKSCVYSVIPNSDILDEANIDFNIALDPSYVPPRTRNQQYVENSQVGTLDIYGGDPSIVDMPARMATFEANPIMPSFTYVPLTKILAALGWPDQWLIDNLNRAVSDYFGSTSDSDLTALSSMQGQVFRGSQKINIQIDIENIAALGPRFCKECMSCNGGCPYRALNSLAAGDSWTPNAGSWKCQGGCTLNPVFSCFRDQVGFLHAGFLSNTSNTSVTTGCVTSGPTTCCYSC